VSASVPTGPDVEPAAAEDVVLQPGANAQQPATVGRDALAPIRTAMGS
jgi:hypothetical protein